MTIEDSFGQVHTDIASLYASSDTITYVHDSGTITGITANYEVIRQRTNVDGDAPVVYQELRWWIRSSDISAATVHVGRDSILGSDSVYHRTIELEQETGSGNHVFLTERVLSYTR